ncbi:transposase [Kineococcus endophyticus]|uniref:transposase n=1 Tax=Kineococcus endophyticus TaxID=1181883 RepID=UPI003F59CD96
MTINPMMDPAHLLDEDLAQASPDLMHIMLRAFIDTLMSADAACGAEYGASSPERVNTRNGYRHRPLDTLPGTIDADTAGPSPSCAQLLLPRLAAGGAPAAPNAP